MISVVPAAVPVPELVLQTPQKAPLFFFSAVPQPHSFFLAVASNYAIPGSVLDRHGSQLARFRNAFPSREGPARAVAPAEETSPPWVEFFTSPLWTWFFLLLSFQKDVCFFLAPGPDKFIGPLFCNPPLTSIELHLQSCQHFLLPKATPPAIFSVRNIRPLFLPLKVLS